jgi:flagellar FliL protein
MQHQQKRHIMVVDDDTPRKKSKLKWIVLIFFLLLLAGGAAGAWFFFLKDMVLSPNPGPSEKHAEQTESKPVALSGIAMDMPTFTTNLADPLGQRFIRLHLELEVADKGVIDEMNRFNARIRDAIIILLSSKSYADIAGPESKMVLKNEIIDRLNSILGPGKVYQVFITDMVIQ